MTETGSNALGQLEMGRGATLKRAVTEANVLLDQLLAADMKTLDLTTAEADVLTVLHVTDQPPVPSQIATWLNLTGAGTTGRLNTLERRGFVERRPNPTDGRSVTVHLTPTGRTLAAAVVDAKNRTIINTLAERLGPAATDDLIDRLAALIALARDVLEDPIA